MSCDDIDWIANNQYDYVAMRLFHLPWLHLEIIVFNQGLLLDEEETILLEGQRALLSFFELLKECYEGLD
tara:strand:+ start:130 stop:339 length:210 start_codon:yes stop_codon:yes gene_type:complete